MAVFAGKSIIANGGNNDRAILNGFYSFPNTVGNIKYVYSGATGGATGWSPADAYTGLQAAHDACTADNGDTIVVLPGHTESVIGAGTIALTKSGINIVGLGNGRTRPVITFSTSTAAQMTMTGANTTISNIVFAMNGIDQIVAAISVTAADVAFDGCEFLIDNGTNKSTILGILTAATAARLRVENCRFLGTAAASTAVTACIQHEVGVDYVIRKNYFVGKMTQAILNATTILRGLIDDNRFVIGTGTAAITMAAASTPLISNNRINVAGGTAPVVAAAGFVVGNAYSAAAGVTAGTALTW